MKKLSALNLQTERTIRRLSFVTCHSFIHHSASHFQRRRRAIFHRTFRPARVFLLEPGKRPQLDP